MHLQANPTDTGMHYHLDLITDLPTAGQLRYDRASHQEMPDLHTGGLRADPGAARWLKGAQAVRRVDRRGSYASV